MSEFIALMDAFLNDANGDDGYLGKFRNAMAASEFRAMAILQELHIDHLNFDEGKMIFQLAQDIMSDPTSYNK